MAAVALGCIIRTSIRFLCSAKSNASLLFFANKRLYDTRFAGKTSPGDHGWKEKGEHLGFRTQSWFDFGLSLVCRFWAVGCPPQSRPPIAGW